MISPKPDLLVLPFRATLAGRRCYLIFDQLITLLNKGQRRRIHIERSYPGAPEAIGWTVFRRRSQAYCYEGEPLFHLERGACRYIRKAYATEYALNSDDLITYCHLNL